MRTPEELQRYRSEYRSRRIPRLYSGSAHAAFTFSLLTGVAIFELARLRAPTLSDAWTPLIVLAVGNLVEYWGHRLPLHRRTPGLGRIFQIHTGEHHRFFSREEPFYESSRDFHTVLFPAWAPGVLVGVLWGATWLLGPRLSVNAAALTVASGCLYFLMYELFHFSHHAGGLKLRPGSWLDRMRTHHLLHHDPRLMSVANFNVTFPVSDLLFGTRSHRHWVEGKKVVLTGAASGIGEDLAVQLATDGAELVLIDLLAEKLERVAERCRGKGAQVRSHAADVTDVARMSEIAAETLARWGSADIVIAGAGLGGINPGRGFSREIDERIMAVNYGGTVNTLTPYIEPMCARRSGTLVGISSLAAFRALPQSASYCASKAAQTRLLDSLRMDLAASGVRVLSVHPGFVATAMADHSEFKMPFKVSVARSTREILGAIRRGSSRHGFPWTMAWISRLSRLVPERAYCWLMPRLGGAPASRARLLSATETPPR
jgi:NAD(P)-dependent dehydrogenase (short-subunit alcohol dehydrogenase family)